MMHDLTNIQKTFNELILSRLGEEVLKRNDIHKDEELIREELFDMKEIIEVPFGSIIYFLVMSLKRIHMNAMIFMMDILQK